LDVGRLRGPGRRLQIYDVKSLATKYCLRTLIAVLNAAAMSCGAQNSAADPSPLVLEAKISLGSVHGRIDHLAVDVDRQRLYVAEIGNHSVAVIDLKAHVIIHTLTDLAEPQGIGYVHSTDTVYVANAADGSVRLFRGGDLTPSGQIELGTDADNVRVDRTGRRVFVGYGSGALAVIDPVIPKKIQDIPLNGHPESFQLERTGHLIFANVPDAHEVAVIDLATSRQIAHWPMKEWRANFPMALDGDAQRVIIGFRDPPTLRIFDGQHGEEIGTVSVCADTDDIFWDARRRRIYISCGEGFIDVLEFRDQQYARIARIATSTGARTALFADELDRLFVAARATPDSEACIWVFRPSS
jgi:hypothetical protein